MDVVAFTPQKCVSQETYFVEIGESALGLVVDAGCATGNANAPETNSSQRAQEEIRGNQHTIR